MHLFKDGNKVFELLSNLFVRIKLDFCIKGPPPSEKGGSFIQPGKGRKTRHPHVTLQIYNPYNKHCIEIQDMKALERLSDELDKALFIGRCMEIDQQCSEELCHDMWGNGISIEHALKGGMLKDRKHIKEDE